MGFDSRRRHHSTRSLRSLAHAALSDPERAQPALRAEGESKGTKPRPFFVYMLRCNDGSLYTGSTDDLAAREKLHNDGRAARYTAIRTPVTLVHSETFESRSAAQAREYQLKRGTRAKKEALIAADTSRLRLLAKRRG